MKISINSWHYRYIGRHWDLNPNNLCSYFWKTVFSIVAWALGFVFGSIVAVGAAIILAYPIWQFFFGINDAGIILSTCAWLGVWFATQYHYRQYLLRTGKVVEDYTVREPGLTRQYLAAKKRKVCPLIEYTYD